MPNDVEVIEEKEVEEKTDSTMSPQEKAEAEAAKAAEEAKAKTEQKPEEELELDGLEKLEDGRYALPFGNSVYYGKTIKEVVANAQKAVTEKDKAYHELKAKQHIRVPKEDDDEVEIPERPSEREFVKAAFQEREIDMKMARWTNAEWKQYATDNNLDSWEVGDLRRSVDQALQSARNRYEDATVGWLNRSTLHQDITPAVQRMVASSGLEAELFGDVYLKILKNPEYTGKDGLLNGTKVVEAMHEEILKHVKPAKESSLLKKTAEEKAKLDEKKKTLASAHTANKTTVNDKAPLNIKEATRRALELLPKR